MKLKNRKKVVKGFMHAPVLPAAIGDREGCVAIYVHTRHYAFTVPVTVTIAWKEEVK